ncbi:hypothetical protein [Streptomyces sp. NBC_01197]|uniref:hypothetical protein n=1 Tax=Streptomyces sp. NBC_01197 TaxID=2903768 RepID=UPI002E0F4FC4|nr:hypothetical protein OG452_25630 [Streptomyces sp. NBC_01197]
MAYEQERMEAAPGQARAERAGRAGTVSDPTAGVQDPVVGEAPDADGNAPVAGAGQGLRGPGVRVPDVRGDGFEAGTAGGHGMAAPVPDSVAESGADPAADVRGTGYETEEAGRHTTAHSTGASIGRGGSFAESRTAGPRTTARTAAVPADAGLVTAGEREQLERRLQGAVSSFVDAPREAVEQADRVLGETITTVTALLTERSNSLRLSWHGKDGGKHGEAETEELRLALRTYREVTERLLTL